MDGNPVLAEEFVKQANAWHRQGEYEQAIAAYQQAIALMPGSRIYLAYHFMIGEMLAEREHYEEAITAYQAAVAAVPPYDEAWFNLGKCLMRLERDEESLGAFKQCLEIMRPKLREDIIEPFYHLEISARTSQAWYYGAIVQARLGRHELAAEYLEQALQLRPALKRRAEQDPLLSQYLH